MLLNKIKFINIPKDSKIAVFGMENDQWTINSSDALTYFSGKCEGEIFELNEFVPDKPKILIRVFSLKYTWRRDKYYKNPINNRYSPELVLITSEIEEFVFDGEEFLEPDDIMVERPVPEPIIRIKNKSDYLPSKEIKIIKPVPSPSKPKFELKEIETKSIVAIVNNFNRIELEDFKHSLPRPIINLLYPPIPIGNNHFKLALFHYDFTNLEEVSKAIIDEKPWFYKRENAELLLKAKKEFIQLILNNVTQLHFLKTRELKDFGYIQEDLPLNLPNVYSSDKRPTWRYLTLPKFIDLLSTSKLWFAKPSTFNDPFESKTNKRTRAEQVWKMINRIVDDYNIAVYEKDEDYLKSHELIVLELEKDKKGKVKPIEFDNFNEIPANLKGYAEYKLNNLLDSMLVNSWHINEDESEGMWNIYSDREFGIAIVSDQESIRNSFRTTFGSPKILQIEYHNLHNEEKTYDYLPSAYKHSAFRHEEELRVYIGVNLPDDSPGISIDVDLRSLIKKIIISPNASSWFRKNVIWLIEKSGHNFEINDSIFKNKLY